MGIKNFFSESDKKSIQEAIATAELNTSGEIRVHIDAKCAEDAKSHAIEVFGKLKMHETELRNGVLFYLAVEDRKFAIIGDEGINNVVTADFWDNIRETMSQYFKQNDFVKGLSEGIKMAGEKLKANFPHQADDTDELSNEISFQE
jgi:uncharacterized membrane protein